MPATSTVSSDALGVRYDEDDWRVDIPCSACGGCRIPLEVNDPARGDLARTRATALLERVRACGGCLCCEARAWRRAGAPPAGDLQVWWDTDSREWMAWMAVPGIDSGISIPLGIHSFFAPQEVRAAARALWSSTRISLRVASGGEEVEGDAATIYYDAEAGRWKLHVPCFECHGFDLSLTSFGRGAVEAACDEALGSLELVAREGCPNCRTKLERAATRDADEPCIWFDTQTRDWVLWQPIEGSEGGVTLPLGLGRFDARRALVYRAAAALLFDSQLFLDGGS